MDRTVIVRYGELALKGPRVRREFESHLLENIRLALKGFNFELIRERGRIFVNNDAPAEAAERLARIPGIVSASPATRISATLEAILSSAVGAAREVISKGGSFAVRTRRVGRHPFSSQEINEEVGAAVLGEIPGTSVDLTSPDHEIFIEIRDRDAYVFTEVVEGVGGLPVGTQGKAVVLFSGEVRDIIAASLILKRGCLVYPTFFGGVAGGARDEVISSCRELLSLHPEIDLRVVAFDEVRRVIEGAPSEFLYLLQIRAMLRAAERIALEVGGEALATGETVGPGQGLALQAFRASDEVIEMSVFRPLAGLSEARIKWLAQRLGVSEVPTSLSGPSYPKRDVNLGGIVSLERELEIDSLIKAALEKVEIVELR